MIRMVAVAIAAAFFALPALAQSKISVSDAWARPPLTPRGAGAAYLTITGHGQADRLIAAKTDVAKRAELHTHMMEGSMAKMRHVDGIAIAAAGKTMLKPGGYHIMLMGIDKPLKAGSHFPLTLVFEKAGEVTVEVEVRPVMPRRR